jgi:hypothetical protein
MHGVMVGVAAGGTVVVVAAWGAVEGTSVPYACSVGRGTKGSDALGAATEGQAGAPDRLPVASG